MCLSLLFILLIPRAADSGDSFKGNPSHEDAPFLVVLGIAQDGGFPQAGCQKTCCASARAKTGARRHISCLAIVDPATSQHWMIDATPDFREQLQMLDRIFLFSVSHELNGIFLTHGHMGHYTGLMHLGREAMGAKGIPVYAMPRMHEFLRRNGPWDQLVGLRNISLNLLEADGEVRLNGRISIIPFLVPHRDEYTETVGYRIRGPERSAVFIPDIDGWEDLDVPIEDLISKVDVAFLDGTFFSEEEIPGRDLSKILHPFIKDTMKRMENLPGSDRSKIHFIHLNHTNPALILGSDARMYIEKKGFRIASENQKFPL